MCELKKYKTSNTQIDSCMRNLIRLLKQFGVNTLACCCGHGKYKMSIIIKDDDGVIFDLMSGVIIKRKRRFYERDEEGYYFIPDNFRLEKNEQKYQNQYKIGGKK